MARDLSQSLSLLAKQESCLQRQLTILHETRKRMESAQKDWDQKQKSDSVIALDDPVPGCEEEWNAAVAGQEIALQDAQTAEASAELNQEQWYTYFNCASP